MNFLKKSPGKGLLSFFGLLIISFTAYSKTSPLSNKGGPTDSTFKSWYYIPSGVIGRNPISKPSGREYFKIFYKNKGEILVYKYNPANRLVNTTEIKIINGLLSLITETNQWGETYDSVWFKPDSPDEFIVTEKLRGENPNVPCQALRYIFKKNLITDIFCMSDSSKTGYNQEGVSHYVFERYNDAERFGLVKTESFFGDIDNFVYSKKEDCHKIVNDYDVEGNLIIKSIYGLKDEPVADRLGSFKTVRRSDKYGNVTEVDHYDVKGVLENEVLGYARLSREFKKGFLAKEVCYDAEYRIVKPSRLMNFIAIIEYKYDDSGNETEISYNNEESHQVNNLKGIHKQVFNYDSSGKLSETSYFNEKGLPVADEYGIHRYIYSRNSMGQISSKTFTNKIGQPAKELNEGAFEIKYTYDGWGRIISTSYWVNDSVKMLSKYGYHETVNSYNTQGLTSSIEFLDMNRSPILNRIGYSKQVLKYNEWAQLSERKFYHEDKPVILKDTNYFASHFHSMKYNYDYNNRIISLEYLDDQGKAIEAEIKLNFNDVIRCEKVEFIYEGNQVIKELFRNYSDSLIERDCSAKNCLLPNGTGLAIKNLKLQFDVATKYRKQAGLNIVDSLFFANQVSFLSKDTILIFLNSNASKLSEQGCAAFYRITPINKYYQMDGEVSDYFVDNGNIASSLKYERGYLNGPAIYYFKNGKVRERGAYKMNVRTGIWDYFYETGLKAKSINFTDSGPLLVDCFAENGKELAQNGNGAFVGTILTGNINFPYRCTITGNIKNGYQDGEWKLYNQFLQEPANIEKFSLGKLKKGISQSLIGKKEYYNNYFCTFESIHPEEHLDHYGQDYYCASKGKKVNSDGHGQTTVFKDFFDDINEGLRNILKDSVYKDYSGWIFIDLKYDENGAITKKYVELYTENARFKNDILKMTERLNYQSPVIEDGQKVAFEKFYIVLVELNQIVIPEEILQRERSIRLR